MTKEISADFNTDYIIIFIDGSKKIFSKEIGEKIMIGSGNGKTFTVDNQLYSYSSISKFIPLAEYYNQYPEARPEVRKSIEFPKVEPRRVTRAEKIKQLQGMIEGIKRPFKNHQMPVGAKEVLRKMEDKLEQVFNSTSDDFPDSAKEALDWMK